MKNSLNPNVKVIQSVETREGSGFSVRRALPTQYLSEWDPFLLLDEIGPEKEVYSPPHPHRGIEILTYVLSGRLHYQDSIGNDAIVNAGCAQLVTAGSGMIQQERWLSEQNEEFSPKHGLRVWLNLPPEHKMTEPRYQVATKDDLEVAYTADMKGTLTSISGGKRNTALQPIIPLQCYEINLLPNGHCNLPVSNNEQGLLYVFEGVARCRNETIKSGDLLIIVQGHTSVEVSNILETPMRGLFLSAQSCGARIARYGPFVMNSHYDLIDAFSDYQKGKMGTMAPKV